MLIISLNLIACATATQPVDSTATPLTAKPVSEVIGTAAGELVLIQKIRLEAPVEAVWAAYTTEAGYTAWAAPKAEIDLAVGGTIRVAYTGDVGGPNTTTLNIESYVPNRLITLRTDVTANWPEILLKDAERLSNVVLFTADGKEATSIESYGIGYTQSPELQQMMKFFISANEGLLNNLRSYLEDGIRQDWQ